MTADLPPIEYTLTPTEKSRAAQYAIWLERMRRRANEIQQARDKVLQAYEFRRVGIDFNEESGLLS